LVNIKKKHMPLSDTTSIYDDVNEKIKLWGGNTKTLLQQRIGALGIRHTAKSQSPRAAANSLRDTYRKRQGLINRIGYTMPRHMIYVHKGVGRGTPIERVGESGRKAKEWYNPVVEKEVEGLADIMAQELGAGIINRLLIR